MAAQSFLDGNGVLYLFEKFKNLFVSKVEGKGLSSNDFSNEDKVKLDGLQNYTLPAATSTDLGGVKVGAGLSVDSSGVLSATGGGTADSVAWDAITGKPDLALKSDLTAVYTYKGSVSTYQDLPTSPEVGDVWNVTDTDMNYAWTGTEWDPLGMTFEITPITNEEIDQILGGEGSNALFR